MVGGGGELTSVDARPIDANVDQTHLEADVPSQPPLTSLSDSTAASSWGGVCVYTIGHSTRSLDELVRMLEAFHVSVLTDIRSIPRSRHNPQFNIEALRATVPAQGIRYAHLATLGGLRRPRKDSPNTAWRNSSFRGFADYMLTEDFEAGLTTLRVLAADATVALMCAEAVPFRCHRSLVADALTVRGAQVLHITSEKHASPHRLTPFVHIDGVRITYPGNGVESE